MAYCGSSREPHESPFVRPCMNPHSLFLLVAALGALGFHPQQDDEQEVSGAEPLTAAFEAAGIQVDYDAEYCAIPAEVVVRNELLEYLLVGSHGAAHESLFLTHVDPEMLNTALLTLGAEPGTNALWAPKDPLPSDEEVRAGVSPYDITLPAGDGFYLYTAWQEGDETYFYRVEDLVRDLARRRTMQRHRWVFLGSRMIARGAEGNEVFAAKAEGNLINVSFFAQGNTLLTAALESCVEQTLWLPNAWLLPPTGSPLLFILSKERLKDLPEALTSEVPTALSEEDDSRGKARRGR